MPVFAADWRAACSLLVTSAFRLAAFTVRVVASRTDLLINLAFSCSAASLSLACSSSSMVTATRSSVPSAVSCARSRRAVALARFSSAEISSLCLPSLLPSRPCPRERRSCSTVMLASMASVFSFSLAVSSFSLAIILP